MSKCFICPRRCGADRSETVGFCGCGERFRVAKVMVHRGEEPIISGERGVIAVFFGGCNLGCVYCQNADISTRAAGKVMDDDALLAAITERKAAGISGVEFVTAAHFAPALARFLARYKEKLGLTVIYNSGGYESAETLALLSGLVDVYLPDFKYFSREIAAKYSSAPDYPEVAEAAIAEMIRQRPKAVIRDGVMREGVLIRHLVLPSCRRDGMEIMRLIARRFGGALVSVMRQYTPQFNRSDFAELNRRVTSFEYESVAGEAARLALSGFRQEKGCATSEFTPDFSDADDGEK